MSQPHGNDYCGDDIVHIDARNLSRAGASLTAIGKDPVRCRDIAERERERKRSKQRSDDGVPNEGFDVSSGDL